MKKLSLTEVRRRLRLAATDILARFGWTGMQIVGGLLAAEPVQHWVNSQLEARLPLWTFQLMAPLTIALIKNVAAALVGQEGTATFTNGPTPTPVVVDPVAPAVAAVAALPDVSPFAVGNLQPPPFREGVEGDSGDADPIEPPPFA